MFGEYAKVLQNEGTSLEAWLKEKVNWRHYWSESIVSFDDTTGGGRGLPSDIVTMVKQNNSIVRGLQSAWDRTNNAAAGSSAAPPGSGEFWSDPEGQFYQQPRQKKRKGRGGNGGGKATGANQTNLGGGKNGGGKNGKNPNGNGDGNRTVNKGNGGG